MNRTAQKSIEHVAVTFGSTVRAAFGLILRAGLFMVLLAVPSYLHAADMSSQQRTANKIATMQMMRSNRAVGTQVDLVALTLGQPRGYFNANAQDTTGTFAFRNKMKKTVWMDLNGSWASQNATDRKMFGAAFGVHREIGAQTYMGMIVKLDHLSFGNANNTGDGMGWMTGPYLTGQVPAKNLRYQLRALYGQSDNDICPLGDTMETFKTHRFLVQGKLEGSVAAGKTTFFPNFKGSFSHDSAGDYSDGMGANMRAQAVKLGEMSVGMDFSRPIDRRDGAMTLTGGLSAGTSSRSGTGLAANMLPGSSGLRGKVELGLDYTLDDRGTITLKTDMQDRGKSVANTYGVTLSYLVAF